MTRKVFEGQWERKVVGKKGNIVWECELPRNHKAIIFFKRQSIEKGNGLIIYSVKKDDEIIFRDKKHYKSRVTDDDINDFVGILEDGLQDYFEDMI